MISGQSAGLWLLADCNNFYASCERLFRPDLRNRPVVVLSNNDGCVIARSAEAKALNISMGEAEFRIHGFLKEHGVAVFSSNFALYGDLSARVIQTLETLCQDVRQYSIDEAFCRLTGAEAANAAELASEARLRVERWTGIPVSIGISSTKTLAKLANHAAKKSGRGLWQVLPGEEDCTRLLRESPVEEVWGVGRRVAARLFSSNFALYGDLSARVIQTLETLCQDVRQYSIDEAFCRLTGAEAANAAELASEARLRVERWTGIPVSIGISSTKTLAKLANHAAKKSGRGLWQVLPGEEDCTRLLRESPVEEVWGVGRRVAARLSAAGIRTAFDLARADDSWIRRRFSVTLWNTALELRGVSAVPDGDPGSIRQTLVVSRSFGHRITRKDLLMEAISAFTERALERLRGERLVARGFSVHVQTSLFEKDGVYANSATVNLPFPSADTALFLKKARGALNAIWKPGYRYARGGVMLFSVEREDRRELSLLAPQKDGKKQARLMKAMDDINARYGHRTVTFASAGLPSDESAPWKMNRSNLSPARTTSWKELATARA